ncbi:hypothetical protein M5D96_005241 [Drosophila gunungcola]|uniref:Uncharacterized protein n=1 Tax=Drosophila gunungcola TaxID=103775 RepID=A0A9P9YQ41_9MUSC|nr:hypothetical protein M5D96_005241 [Drosophila gunungcola]
MGYRFSFGRILLLHSVLWTNSQLDACPPGAFPPDGAGS